MAHQVVTIILAGGQGKRLYPLTKMRSKPAVPIAGKFRLIDIPLSNCIHSNLRRIFVSTQYSTESLHRHISTTYRFDPFSKGYVTILSAQQTAESTSWYQGTADAVRQNLRFLRKEGDLVLILSGDHLYRMDYRKFINFHLKKKADISISVYPVPYDQAPEFGVMKVDREGRIVQFMEKPTREEDLREMMVPREVFEQFHLEPGNRTHLASMGIYIFNWEVLVELLENTHATDFGKEVIPDAIFRKNVYGYFFDGYWEDIGTIRSFFEAHMDLTKPLPKFNFYDEEHPIFTHARFLPASKVLESRVKESIMAEGSIINKSEITSSIIGVRSRIEANSVLENVVMMGADFFETADELRQNKRSGIPNVGIGEGCELRNVILDKNVRIGKHVRLVNKNNIQEFDNEMYSIRDGIIVVPKNTIIPDGTEI